MTNAVEVASLAPIEAGKASEKAPPKAAEPPAKAKETPAAKPPEMPTAKPQAKPEEKPVAKPENKPAVKPENKPAPKPENKPDAKHSRNDLPPDSMLAMAGPSALALADVKPNAKSPPAGPKTTSPPAERPPAAGQPAAVDALAGGSRCTLKFDFKVNHKTAEEMVRTALEANAIDVEQTPVRLDQPGLRRGQRHALLPRGLCGSSCRRRRPERS